MTPALLIPVPFILLLGFFGYREGVVKRLVEIAGVIATLILTARFAAAVQPWVSEHTGAPEGSALLITWALLFFAGLILSHILAALISKLIRLTILGWLDRWGGAVIGAAIGVLLASVIVILVGQVPGGERLRAAYLESPAGRFFYYAAPNLYQQARELVGARADAVWSRVLADASAGLDRTADQAADKAAQAQEKLEDAAKEAVSR